jgi:hypothetical protein
LITMPFKVWHGSCFSIYSSKRVSWQNNLI